MTRAGVLCVVLLAGCLSQPRTPEPALYDLGIAPAAGALRPASKATPAVTRVQVAARSWLDDTAMHYRLMYVDEMRTLAYAYAQWIAPPAELIGQRLRQRLPENGAPAGSGAARELEIELEEFVQVFETPAQSFGRIVVEVRLRTADAPIETARFSEQAPAPTADAAGGVRALAAATDALVARIVDWVGARGNRSSRLIKGFHGEALAGEWKDYRSSRLGDQWRVIYRVVTGDLLFQVASITPHEYRRP